MGVATSAGAWRTGVGGVLTTEPGAELTTVTFVGAINGTAGTDGVTMFGGGGGGCDICAIVSTRLRAFRC